MVRFCFVDNLALADGKTKSAFETMKSFSTVDGFKTINWQKHNNAVVFTSSKDRKTHLAFRNLPNVRLENMDQMEPSSNC